MAAKDRNLLIVLVGVLLLVACYFFVYRPKMTENQTLTSENYTLSARLDELNSMTEQESFYREEITRIENGIKQELTKFPSALQYENGIMDVVDLEHFANAKISSLTVGEPAYVSAGAEDPSEDGSETAAGSTASAAANQYSLYGVTTDIVYSASYTDTKTLIGMIADEQNKRCMRSFTATYDASTGLLSGAIEFVSYYIDGQDDKPYVQADIPAMSHGVDNIFGTIEYAAPEADGAEAPAEAAPDAGMQE
jgi:hypothetical protein